MTGYIDSPPEGSVAIAQQGIDAIPSATGEVLGAAAAGGFAHAFPTLEIGRLNTEMGIDPNTGMPIPQGRMIDPGEANERFGIEGRLKFSAPLPEDVAQEQQRRKREELAREDIINRREGGLLTGGVARFAGGLAGGLPGIVDPINIAASFMPVVPEARAALWAARGGIAARAGIGGLQGAAGMAALVPLQYGLAKSEQEDYGAVDAILNIALGGVFGGGLHALIGRNPTPETQRTAIAIEHAAPETREALLRGAVADMAEGRPVETPSYIAETPDGARPYETVPKEPERLSSFLQRQGGMQDQGGELAARDAARARPGLVNRAGLSLDEATLRAWQEGFLPGQERPEINTLLDHLDRDLRGDPVYREQDEFSAAEHRDALARNSEIDRLSQEHDIPVSGKTQQQFYDAVAAKLGREAAGAEAERAAGHAENIMAKAAAEGWVPDFGEGSPTTPEEIENAYRQDAAARGASPGEGGLGQPRIVGRAAGIDETGLGRGGRGAGAGRRVEPPGLELPAELTAEEAKAPLDRLNEEIATLERELGPAEGERPAELEAADRLLADAEAEARAIEQSGVCLGRRL